jgi:hypothetical protein
VRNHRNAWAVGVALRAVPKVSQIFLEAGGCRLHPNKRLERLDRRLVGAVGGAEELGYLRKAMVHQLAMSDRDGLLAVCQCED